jgi:hypothetical protein
MNEFLLVALVFVYLAISYVPISEAPKARGKANATSDARGDTETDAARQQ